MKQQIESLLLKHRSFRGRGELDEQCVPKVLKVGDEHMFLVEGQKDSLVGKSAHIVKTEGRNESEPLALVEVLNSHLVDNENLVGDYTTGTYRILEVY